MLAGIAEPAPAQFVYDCSGDPQSVEKFTDGTQGMSFQPSSRYESIMFLSTPTTAAVDWTEAQAFDLAGRPGIKVNQLLVGNSLAEYRTALMKLLPNDDADDVRLGLPGNAVAGRDRTRDSGNPVFDAGDVDVVLVNRIIIQFRPGVAQATIDGLLACYRARALEQRRRGGGARYVVTFDGQSARHALAMANQLNLESEVDFAQPDWIVISSGPVLGGPASISGPDCPQAPPPATTDPYFALQWHLGGSVGQAAAPAIHLNAQPAWAQSKGEGVVLAVLDDGVETTHEDLAGKFFRTWNAFTGEDDLLVTPQDRHGTAVAGIAGAATGNPVGVKAVAPEVMLMPIRLIRWMRAIDPGGFPIWAAEYPYSAVAKGIEVAACHADVLSMSLSLGQYDEWAHKDVVASIDAALCLNGVPIGDLCPGAVSCKPRVMVFAAGNDGAGYVVFPARLSESRPVIAVGASDSSDEVKQRDFTKASDWGSNYGPELTVVAPGLDIVTTDRTAAGGYCAENYVRFVGTSAATPIVAGVAALMQAEHLAMGSGPAPPATIRSRLQETALLPMGRSRPDPRYGYGRVRACEALAGANCQVERISTQVQEDGDLGADERGMSASGWALGLILLVVPLVLIAIVL